MTTIQVEDSVMGKFGEQLKDDKGYLSFGKFYKGPKAFNRGTVLEVDLFVSEKSGARYINSAKVMSQPETKPESTPRGRPKAKTAEPTNPTPEYKPRDFDKENRGKVKSLFIEALLSNPNVVTALNSEELAGLNTKEVQAELNKLVESVF